MLGTLVGTVGGPRNPLAFRAAWSAPDCRGAMVAWSAWLLDADGHPAQELGGRLPLPAAARSDDVADAVRAAIEARAPGASAIPAGRALRLSPLSA